MDKLKEEYKDLLKTDKIKVVITDLDDTLWSGVLAEKQNPILNKKYYSFLESLYHKGVQIIVVSKNDEPDVLNAFSKLKLNKDIFTLIVANWDPKYLNIDRIIQQMNLRPETVIFIDDNLLELSEVKNKISKIHTIDAKDWDLLETLPYLKEKKKENIMEIKERINRYKTAFLSKKLIKDSKEDAKFLKSLKRELSIGPISADNLDRFTKLLVVTHRLNFNPDKFEKYDEALDYLFDKINKGYKLYAISTRENDISLGLTGALVVKIDNNKAIVEDGTFSCGIIGRDFEQKSLLALVELLKKDKIKELELIVSHTSTNVRIKEIFEELGFSAKKIEGNKSIYFINLNKYNPKQTYGWIKVLSTPPELDYFGIPSIIDFFDKRIKPIIKEKFNMINLGSGRGEALGLLQKDQKEEFYKLIREKDIIYNKLDIEYYPDEKNLIGNAEDMSDIISDESQDLVMAIELLEHTENFWKVINEMIRICKVNGYLFITSPSYKYPKHEYPVDRWRIGPKTMASFFPKEYFKIVGLETEGNKKIPRRTMILVKKLKKFSKKHTIPKDGKVDWNTGLTIFD